MRIRPKQAPGQCPRGNKRLCKTMKSLSLPKDSALWSKAFTFGVATSSFQIEGAVNERALSIWDTFCDKPGAIKDQSTGEVACEHIERWADDVELIKSLNVDSYRLSISWPRVINENGMVNQQGLAFYSQLIKALKETGIDVFVTLYHWDLPQYLEDKGGWLNRDTAYEFEKYTQVVVETLKEDVTAFTTLNEPWCSAYLGYEAGIHAPGKTGRDNGLVAAHHLLLAHGLAMRVLNTQSPNTENGIVLNFSPCYPFNDTSEDKKASVLADQYFNHWYLKPVIDGAYPAIFESELEATGVVQPGDMAIIQQPMDYLGVNYYTRSYFSHDHQSGFVSCPAKDDELTAMGWEIFPQGLTDILIDLNNQYSLPPIYITENGAAMDDEIIDGKVEDTKRVAYFQSHLKAVDTAINQGVDIKGYFAWSLMDNFEWAEGYEKRFGIVYVDFETQKRTIKQSGLAYSQLLAERKQQQ